MLSIKNERRDTLKGEMTMHLIRSAIAPAVDLHEVLPEIYNLKGR